MQPGSDNYYHNYCSYYLQLHRRKPRFFSGGFL